MTEQAQTPASADDNSPLTIGEAFAATRPPATDRPEDEQNNGQNAPSGEDDASAAPQEPGDDPDAAAPDDQEPRGEDAGQEDAADEQPPIAQPRSWTKDEKKAFAALPREVQETISERERARDADIGRRQNEVAERVRAAEAREQAAEQARKAYEERLPMLVEAIQAQANAEFADIRTWDDVQRMAREDPARYNVWDAMRKQQESFQAEIAASQQRQQQESYQRARNFYNEQMKLFVEKAPEFADPKKAAELRTEAIATLEEIGFSPEVINQAWDTGDSIPVHDHRFQLLVRKAMLYDRAQKAVKKAAAAPKPAPQVQRPGPAVSQKDQRSEHLKNLDNRLSKTGKLKDALAILRASR